jgi:hypothetical protein
MPTTIYEDSSSSKSTWSISVTHNDNPKHYQPKALTSVSAAFYNACNQVGLHKVKAACVKEVRWPA